MMINMFDNVLRTLQSRPGQLVKKDEWLFVTVNTMKAIIDNSQKNDIQEVLKATECMTTSELQRMYDVIQGKYGREGFSYRNASTYYYLSSLVARYPDEELNEKDKEIIVDFYGETEYLLYKL